MAWLGLGMPSYRSNLSENLFGESVAEPSLSESVDHFSRRAETPKLHCCYCYKPAPTKTHQHTVSHSLETAPRTRAHKGAGVVLHTRSLSFPPPACLRPRVPAATPSPLPSVPPARTMRVRTDLRAALTSRGPARGLPQPSVATIAARCPPRARLATCYATAIAALSSLSKCGVPRPDTGSHPTAAAHPHSYSPPLRLMALVPLTTSKNAEGF